MDPALSETCYKTPFITWAPYFTIFQVLLKRQKHVLKSNQTFQQVLILILTKPPSFYYEPLLLMNAIIWTFSKAVQIGSRTFWP